MAITGLMLLGFVATHLSGNLLIYQGSEAINNYARGLRALPLELLNVLRAGLLVVFIVHVFTAVKLQLANKEARPVKYSFGHTIQASMASRTMIFSGLLILFFIVFHLAHYTWHMVHPVPPLADGQPDVYKMVIAGFSQVHLSVTYIVAMVVLGFHLQHGISSAIQTIGINHKKYAQLISVGGCLVAWALALGNISIPVSVMMGIVQ